MQASLGSGSAAHPSSAAPLNPGSVYLDEDDDGFGQDNGSGDFSSEDDKGIKQGGRSGGDSEDDESIDQGGGSDSDDEGIDEDGGDTDLVPVGGLETEPGLIDSAEDLEAASWAFCTDFIETEYPGAVLVVSLGERRLPSRLIGLVAIWFCNDDAEWDVVRIEQSSKNVEGAYRIQSLTSLRWFLNIVLAPVTSYGKSNHSFVLLTPRGGVVSSYLRFK